MSTEPNELIEMTYRFVQAYESRDVEKIEEFLSEDIVVTCGTTLTGIEQVVTKLKEYFSVTIAHSVVCSDVFAVSDLDMSIVEYDYAVSCADGEKRHYRCTDHIRWTSDGKIESTESFMYRTEVKLYLNKESKV